MRISETISKLKQLERETPCLKMYYVGGFVRDNLIQIPPKDIDIVACGIKEPDLYNLLKELGEINLVGACFGIYLFRADKRENFVEITLPRKEKSTGSGHRDFDIIVGPDIPLKEDSNRRDFTINAMYLPINFESKCEVLDYHKGLRDLDNRIVRFIGDPAKRIYEDPLRIMRAFSLMSRGFRIYKSSKDAIAALSYLLEEISVERIRIELEKIILSNKPSRTLKQMLRLGVLDIILPELSECVGVSQSKRYHKFDVITHCMYACDNTPQDLILRLAALLHDIGKPVVREIKERHYTFYNHEIVSEKKARNLLERLRFSNEIVSKVCFLIGHHMFHYTSEWKDKTVRKFIKQTGIDQETIKDLESFPLFLLRRADRLGSGFKTIPVTQRQKDFEHRIMKIMDKPVVLKIADLDLDGWDIMKEFNLKPSPLIGRILKDLLEIVLEDPSKNKKEVLLSEAKKIINKMD